MTGNPAPRPALPRTGPVLPGDAHVGLTELPDASTPRATPDPPGPADVDPGPTTGRDLLIRAAPESRPTSKKARGSATVPSLRDLMPDSAPRVVAPELPKPEPSKAAERKPDGPKTKGRATLPQPPPPGKHDKHVEVVLTMPKGLRKRLRTRADEMGMTVEQMITQLAEVWIDG